MKSKNGYTINGDSGEIFVGKRVNTRRASMFDFYAEYISRQRAGKCRVYWGRHSCNLTPGHLNEDHVCHCGCSPLYYSVLWGEDLTDFDLAEYPFRLKALEKEERRYSWHDDFDKRGNYRPSKRGAKAA